MTDSFTQGIKTVLASVSGGPLARVRHRGEAAEVTAAGASLKEPADDVDGGAWWPPSPITMATSSAWFRTDERR